MLAAGFFFDVTVNADVFNIENRRENVNDFDRTSVDNLYKEPKSDVSPSITLAGSRAEQKTTRRIPISIMDTVCSKNP
jgi:hypothetical protein